MVFLMVTAQIRTANHDRSFSYGDARPYLLNLSNVLFIERLDRFALIKLTSEPYLAITLDEYDRIERVITEGWDGSH